MLLLAFDLARAATCPPTGLCDPALYTLDPASPFNPLEIAAAQANQETYNALLAKCNVSCSAAERNVLLGATRLVDTADALLGQGPTGQSFGLDITGLRLALRWTAATEVAAIGSINTKFSANQLSGLATRLSALRWGASGIAQVSLMGAPSDAAAALAAATVPSGGGGAGADSPGVGSPFSMYFNESYDFGTKAPTVLEDAFAFDGREYTLGGDYRFSPQFVLGAVFGISSKRVDFNSDLSTVDGGIRAKGDSGIVYGMYEAQNLYVSLAAGFQRLSYDITRRITYASLNPVVSAVDSTALSNTASNALLASLNVGYSLHSGAWELEPFAIAAYKDIRVDPFEEQSHQTANPSVLDGHGLAIAPQTIISMEVSAGLKLDYVWTSRFGVLVPFIDGEYHRQLADKTRIYTATYAEAAADIGTLASFVQRTDPAPEHYFTASAGFSLVLPHNVQGFIEYARLLDYTHYTDTMVTGGIRVEF